VTARVTARPNPPASGMDGPNPPAPFPTREGGVAAAARAAGIRARRWSGGGWPNPPATGSYGPNPPAPFPTREGGVTAAAWSADMRARRWSHGVTPSRVPKAIRRHAPFGVMPPSPSGRDARGPRVRLVRAVWSAGILARLSSGRHEPSPPATGIDGPNPPAPFPTREGGVTAAAWSADMRARLSSDSGAPVQYPHRSHGATSVEAKAELPQC
jgi:hypothetical protein